MMIQVHQQNWGGYQWGRSFILLAGCCFVGGKGLAETFSQGVIRFFFEKNVGGYQNSEDMIRECVLSCHTKRCVRILMPDQFSDGRVLIRIGLVRLVPDKKAMSLESRTISDARLRASIYFFDRNGSDCFRQSRSDATESIFE
jgi:hypothetical protein